MSNKDEKNYVAIQTWMVSELKLSGNDLIVYALIYGFNSNKRRFIGTLDYISKFTGCSIRQISRILDNLVERGLLSKRKFTLNRANRCEYSCNIDFSAENKADLDAAVVCDTENSHPDNMSESHPDNMTNNNINNTSYYSNTSYYHTSYDNTRIRDNTRTPGPEAQVTSDVAKLLSRDTKTRGRVNSVLAYIQKKGVDRKVYDLFVEYLTSLIEMDRAFSFKSMQKQIDALLELTTEQQVRATEETVMNGWKSLKYSIENIQKEKEIKPSKFTTYDKTGGPGQLYTKEEKEALRKEILENSKNQPRY